MELQQYRESERDRGIMLIDIHITVSIDLNYVMTVKPILPVIFFPQKNIKKNIRILLLAQCIV